MCYSNIYTLKGQPPQIIGLISVEITHDSFSNYEFKYSIMEQMELIEEQREIIGSFDFSFKLVNLETSR